MPHFFSFASLQDQSLVWDIYIAAALIFLLAYTQITRRWWFELRWLLFVLLAVFLLIPGPVPGKNLQAPAMIILALSKVTGSPELIGTVLARFSVAVFVVIVVSIVRRLWRRRRRVASQ